MVDWVILLVNDVPFPIITTGKQIIILYGSWFPLLVMGRGYDGSP